MQFLYAAAACSEINYAFNNLSLVGLESWRHGLMSLAGIAAIFCYFRLFQGRQSWFFWSAIAAFAAIPVIDGLTRIDVITGGIMSIFIAFLNVVGYSELIHLTWQAVRRELPDAWLLFIPLLV